MRLDHVRLCRFGSDGGGVGNDVAGSCDQIRLGCCHGEGGLVVVEIGGRVMLGLDMVAQAVEEIRGLIFIFS